MTFCDIQVSYALKHDFPQNTYIPLAVGVGAQCGRPTSKGFLARRRNGGIRSDPRACCDAPSRESEARVDYAHACVARTCHVCRL